MNQEETIHLIELYRNHSFLWNPKHKAHHDRAKREVAWKEISTILKQPVPTLKTKMKTLMGSYRSEKSRINRSRSTGSGRENAYESKWFAYKYFDFLKDKNNSNVTLDADRSEESQGVTTEVISETPSVATTSTAASRNSTFRTTTRKEDRKRKKVRDNSESDKVMGQALQILQSPVTALNDSYFTFTLNLANELRKYDAQTLAHVKRAIADILFEADMGRMPSYPTTPYGSNLHRQQVYLSSSGTPSPYDYGSQISSGTTSPQQGDEQQPQDTQQRQNSSAVSSSLVQPDGNVFFNLQN